MRALALIASLLFAACGSAQKVEVPPPTPQATPAPLKQAEPIEKSKLEPADESYALYLEKILDEMSTGRDEKLLLNYVRYLHYRKSNFSTDYVNQLVKEADERDGLVPNVNIFEGAFILCQFENQRCVKSLGDLTRKYLVPRVTEGDPAALEILVLQAALVDADDLEAEALQDILSDPQTKRFSSVIREIKKRHRKILSRSL